MNCIALIISGRIPSKKNSRPPFANRGRIPLSEKYRDWENDAGLQLIKYKGLKIEKAEVQLEFYFPDNLACDLTNKAEGVMDVLVKLEILKDDRWQFVNDVHLRSCGISRENPRVEIWIKTK